MLVVFSRHVASNKHVRQKLLSIDLFFYRYFLINYTIVEWKCKYEYLPSEKKSIVKIHFLRNGYYISEQKLIIAVVACKN